MTELKPITEDNFIEAFNLKLAPEQEKFVSHPIRSLAQAYVYRSQCQPFGIYADGKMVGYVMVIYDYDIPEYDVWHMMIDRNSQGKIFGSLRKPQTKLTKRTVFFGHTRCLTTITRGLLCASSPLEVSSYIFGVAHAKIAQKSRVTAAKRLTRSSSTFARNPLAIRTGSR